MNQNQADKSAQGVDHVVQQGVVGGQSLGAHVARGATVITHVAETSNVGASVDAEGLVDLFLAVDSQFVQGAGAAGDQAVVDETQVVNEVTLALLFALSGALAGLTAGGAVGVLAVHSVDSALSDGVVVTGQLLSSFQTSSSALDGTLHGLHVGGGGEAGSAIGGADNGGDDRLHDLEVVGFGRLERYGSADGADHHVEVAGSFAGEAGAITLGNSGFLGLAVGVGDEGSGSGLHDGHSAGSRAGGNAQGGIGFTQAVQAAILEHGSVAGQQGIADITENDLTVAQASSHFAVGVHTTVRGGQACVLAADTCNSIRNDASSVRGESVDSVETLVALRNEGLEGGQLASTDEGAAGIGRDGLPGECVEHG